MEGLLYIVVGVAAGVLSGLIGIGGGIIFVWALVFLFGLSQHEAQGTTLALMVPPIGLPSAWIYYKHGHVNFDVALFICAGFLLGGFVGAKLATGLSPLWLERIFGAVMLVFSLKMLLAR